MCLPIKFNSPIGHSERIIYKCVYTEVTVPVKVFTVIKLGG